MLRLENHFGFRANTEPRIRITGLAHHANRTALRTECARWILEHISASGMLGPRAGRLNRVVEVSNAPKDPRSFLASLNVAPHSLRLPGLRGRDPRNPQRKIIDTFLEEEAGHGLVRGSCLEFDEELYMARFAGCTHRTVLKFRENRSEPDHDTQGRVTTAYGDLLTGGTLPADHFDTVFFTEVLEHLRYPDTGARELFRIVAPCGHVLLIFFSPHTLYLPGAP